MGRKHVTRAFNTETAEQLNSWLNGFEPQVRQMTEETFDFFIQSILLLFHENVQHRIEKQERKMPEDFFED